MSEPRLPRARDSRARRAPHDCVCAMYSTFGRKNGALVTRVGGRGSIERRRSAQLSCFIGGLTMYQPSA